MNRILLFCSLCLTTYLIHAQNYSLPLEGITKVIISAETNIVVQGHTKNTFLLKESDNYKSTNLEKSAGFKSLTSNGHDNTGFGVEVSRNGSLLIVKGLRERRESNLKILLPQELNMSIESLDHNDIFIDNFSSEIEAINDHGETVISNITGPVISENGNGNVTIIFTKLNQSSPSSIVTTNGDIDISISASETATLFSKTPRGDFFTELDLDIISENQSRAKRRTVKGKLNGGGIDITLQNLKGNIYLRKI